MIPDFTPTAETISLHGLGFIQVKLPAKRRLHVWHPDLPRRECYKHSAIHNHRFAFRSTVLAGVQKNRRYRMEMHPQGEYEAISHAGPRSEKGGRLSFVCGRVNMHAGPIETYGPGNSYEMAEQEFHATPNDGVVITLMEKLTEGTVHANSVIRHGYFFDYDFDRFQLPPERLWDFVIAAFDRHS
jgi:hypothetical protein